MIISLLSTTEKKRTRKRWFQKAESLLCPKEIFISPVMFQFQFQFPQIGKSYIYNCQNRLLLQAAPFNKVNRKYSTYVRTTHTQKHTGSKCSDLKELSRGEFMFDMLKWNIFQALVNFSFNSHVLFSRY